MENEIQELLTKMKTDKSICDLLAVANETTTTTIKYSEVCKAASKQIDLYVTGLEKILNDRNSVDEGEKSFVPCGFCKEGMGCKLLRRCLNFNKNYNK